MVYSSCGDILLWLLLFVLLLPLILTLTALRRRQGLSFAMIGEYFLSNFHYLMLQILRGGQKDTLAPLPTLKVEGASAPSAPPRFRRLWSRRHQGFYYVKRLQWVKLLSNDLFIIIIA